MASRRIVDLLLTIVSLAFLIGALILPGLRYFFVEPSENLVDKVSSYLAPFDYFYLSREELTGRWSYMVDTLERGNINLYCIPSYDDSSWSRVDAPFLFKATSSNSSLWVRTSFRVPSAMREQRLRLVFSGVWVAAKAWLNGFYLGEHVGYFSQFFFDIDSFVIRDGVNVLVMYLESPVQDTYDSRVYPMGIYSFSEILPDLHNTYIGISGGVTLVGTLNPVINLVLVDVEQYSNPASLSFRVLVQNKGDVEESFRALLRIKTFSPDNASILEQSFNIRLSAKEERWETFRVSLRDPAYWFPWDIGFPNVYLVNISLHQNDGYAGSVGTIFGVRSLEGSISQKNHYVKINNRNIFLKGGSYFSKLNFDTSLYTKMNETLSLLREANVNFLRAFVHVEPKEFYELTSVKGFIVQLDFPLIGSYPALDYSEHYSGLVKKQLVELLLLTYNYPSIAIVCPHTLPGWLDRESPYYDAATNFQLDRDLDILVKEVNRKVIVLSYIEEYDYVDRFIDYGWGTGSWVDYIHYKEVFPNLVSPVSLPSQDSRFWSTVPALPYEQVIQVLEKEGLEPRFLNTYWRTEADNLTSLIELSQKYQCVVLRHAIDRARILKHNVSIGVNILPLTDYPMLVSGSILDYYGFRKQSYYEVKNAFNPVHAVIAIDGDYRHNLTSLHFSPGSTIRISLWLVNDAFQEPLDAVLVWRVTDLTSNKPLLEDRIEVKIPSSSSPAFLAVKHLFEAPHYVDSEHLLEVSTELLLANGTKIDSNSKSFVVKPSSLLKISLNPKPKEPQLFLVFANNTYTVTRILDEATIAVPSDSEVTIIGPSLNKKDAYVPQIITPGRLSIKEVRNVGINLCPGAIVKVLAAVPSPFDLKIPLQETHIHTISETPSNSLILNYDLNTLLMLNMLNITGSTIVVPAETDLSIWIRIKTSGTESIVEIGNASRPIRFNRNTEIYLDHPAFLQVKSNQYYVNETVKSAKKHVEEARNIGFYIGLELYRMQQVEKLSWLALNISDPITILTHQQEAVINSMLIIESIQSMLRESYTGQILVFVIVTFLSLSIGAIFIEKKEQYIVFSTIAFMILMTIAYQAFPGFSKATVLELCIGVYVALLIFSIVFFTPHFVEIKSERGVSMVAALVIAVSYSIGHLKKRKFRTILTLVSITVMILATSILTSVRFSLMTSTLTVTKTWPADRPPLSMVTKPSGPLTFEDIGFIGAQREISRIDYKVITPIVRDALGYIGRVPIYGVRGISIGDPSLHLVKSATYPGDALEKLFNNSNTVLISRYLASNADMDVGMIIVFRGVELKIVGIFDEKLINEIREPDSSNFLPLYSPLLSDSGQLSVFPVPGDNLLLTDVYTAQKLGGFVSSVYCRFENNTQAKEVSKRLAFLGDYFVISMPSSESITYYFRGGSVEIFGASILVPIIITILNIAILFYTSVYERKNEIFIFSAIGLNPTNISTLLLVEAGVLGFIGGSIGYVLSIVIFKIFDVSDLVIPIDAKTTPLDMFSLIIIASVTAIIASLFPALKAAKIATPSLLRRWRMEEKIVKGGIWTVRIPIRIPSEKSDVFVNYLYERLPQSGTLEIIISNVKREEKTDENGNASYLVSFMYGKGGNKPFNAYTEIEIKRDGEDYAAYVHVAPESVYKVMAESNAYEVITHIRKLALEWSALRFNVALVMGESIEHVLEVVRKYHPQLLIVYSVSDVSNKLRELRRRIRSEDMWPPRIETRRIESRDMNLLIEKLSEEVASIDAVCPDSDDGFLNLALTMAAIRLDKIILAFDLEGKMHEISARKFVGSTYQEVL